MDALPRLQFAVLEHGVDRLVLAEPDNLGDPRAAVAIGAFDHADVGDLAAAGGVEGRIGELQQHPPVDALQRLHGGRLLGRLVADETRRKAGGAGEGARLVAIGGGSAAGGCRLVVAASPALVRHQLIEGRLIEPQAVAREQLPGQLDREAEGVVQTERVGPRELAPAILSRALDQLAQHHEPLLERVTEVLLLSREPDVDLLAVHVELGVGGTHQLAHQLAVAHEEPRRAAERATVEHGAAHHAAQHIPSLGVRRHDAVGDQEGHSARMIGEHAKAPVDVVIAAVATARQRLPQLDQGAELVRVEDGRSVLEDHRHAVEAETRIDVASGQRRQLLGRILVVLMKTRFQNSTKRAFSPPGRSSGLPNWTPRSR